MQVCIFGVDVEFDPCHRYIEVNAVEDLAESGTMSRCVRRLQWRGGKGGSAGEGLNLPSSTLFNLGDVELEEIVEPCYELLSRKRVVRCLVFEAAPILGC